MEGGRGGGRAACDLMIENDTRYSLTILGLEELRVLLSVETGGIFYQSEKFCRSSRGFATRFYLGKS